MGPFPGTTPAGPGLGERARERAKAVRSARDRPALLNRLARALFEARLIVHSAHVATYGERAVDTFYVTDLLGGKVDTPARLRAIEKRLLEAAHDPGETAVAA